MPEQNDPAKEPGEPWEGWRHDPIAEPARGWSVEVHQGPSFTFRSPEGQKYTVNGPDGATSEQAFGILQGWIAGNQKAEAPSAEHGPWENYAPLPVAASEDYPEPDALSTGDDRWRKDPIGEPHGPWKVDPGNGLSEFEARCLEEVLNTPLSELVTGDDRICTEAQWFFGPTVGNA